MSDTAFETVKARHTDGAGTKDRNLPLLEELTGHDWGRGCGGWKAGR